MKQMIQLDFAAFPLLTTERLLLRSLQPYDVNEIFTLRSNDEINKYINRPKAHSIEDAAHFIQMILKRVQANETFIWAIQLKDESTLAGTVLLWNINKEKSEAELGYELLPQYHGKGIAQEAITAILTFGFGSLKLHSIVAIVHKDNIASVKTLLRNKFILTGYPDSDLIQFTLSVKEF